MKSTRLVYHGVPVLILVAGCTIPPRVSDSNAKRQMLDLLMPSRIEIVEPFTRVRSFDGDTTPDGIELLLQAVNALDNPGLMISGQLRVELYEYVPASGNHEGRRLEHWDIDLTTARQQRKYWNALTQMYELRLGIDPSRIKPAEKYLLSVTYLSPFTQRLTDEYLLSERSVPARLRTRQSKRR